jgi:hypothetical protein
MNRTATTTLSLLLFPLLLAVHLRAGESLKPTRTETPPAIDGKLDDPVWNTAMMVTGFRTFAPDFGKAVPESTVAYAAYDDENLYFAFRCFDPTPSNIKASVSQRDNIRTDDWICLNIDTFSDQQSLFAFYVNPLGIQMDSRGNNTMEDISVDFVWNSAGRIDEYGYTVEAGIPLKSIRYASGDPTSMSIFFERLIARRQEHVSFPPFDPAKGYQFLTQMQALEYRGLKHYAFWELLPAFTYSNLRHQDRGTLTKYVDRGELGLTAKYGITPQLILDGTYNPDFSQVEADAGQVDVNLRSPLFFNEKRPFFLEGTDILTLGGIDQSRQDGILYGVYTRTIVDPLAGVKLSGKVSREGTLAAVFALDDLTNGRSIVYGKNALTSILRYKQALNEDSYVGALYTSRDWGPTFNRAGGFDGVQRISPSSTLEYHLLGSATRPTDSSATLGGHALSVLYRLTTRDIEWGMEGNELSERFQLDAGYLTRTGILCLNAYVIPKIYPSSSLFDRFDLATFVSVLRDEPSGLWETNNRFTLSAVILGSLSASVRYNYATEVFAGKRFSDNAFQFFGGGQFSRTVNFQLSCRYGNGVIYQASPEQGNGTVASAALTYQPSEHVDITATGTYANLFRSSDNSLVYEYPIARLRVKYQLNQYWFIRAIAEYNGYRKSLTDDFLLSFTYIPGTVMYLGYGSLFERTVWDHTSYVPSTSYLETYRGIFVKVSYLWRS